MPNLETSYLGLTLNNPLVAASSGLTSNLSKIQRLEESGIGAVVLKSVFEEQIEGKALSLSYYSQYPEALDYLAGYTRQHTLQEHLELIASVKRECDIPVIASISCLTGEEWLDYALNIQQAGADALELNIYIVPYHRDLKSRAVEREYLDIVYKVCRAVSLPVSVKLGAQFSNIPYMVREINSAGAKGVVLFNRYYEPDIDIEKMEMVPSVVFSQPVEFRSVLRWLAICSSYVDTVDYGASTGIHTGATLVKALLAGADVAEICSVLYQQGYGSIREMLEFLNDWMKRHRFVNVRDMIGKMNYANAEKPVMYERTQFMKYYALQDEL